MTIIVKRDAKAEDIKKLTLSFAGPILMRDFEANIATIMKVFAVKKKKKKKKKVIIIDR